MKRISLILFMLSCLFSSCSEGINADVAAKDNILLMGNSADPSTIDPSLATGLAEAKIIYALFEGLVSADEKSLEIIPAQAESWEISPDGKVYTFKIRDNAFWTNGDSVQAKDFIYAFKRILNPKLGAEYANMLFPIKNARALNKGELKDFDLLGARAKGDKVLEIELEKPNKNFLNLLYHMSYMPLNERNITEFDAFARRQSKWTRAKNIVTNGAFTLEKYSINDEVFVKKNPHYWDAKNIALAGIRFFPITNINTEDRAFFANQLHLTDNVSPQRLESENLNPTGFLKSQDWLGVYYYIFNTQKAPLDNPLVRKAINLAINREQIVKSVLKDAHKTAYNFVPDSDLYSKIDIENISQAKALLKEAGYENGVGLPPIELSYNSSEQHKPIAETIQEMLRKNLGIKINLYNMSWPAYLDARRNKDFQITRASWVADYNSAENFLANFTSYSSLNHGLWKNKDFDSAIEAQDYLKAEKILMQEDAVIPIFFYKRNYLQSPRLEWHSNLLDYHNYKRAKFKEGQND